MAKQRHLVICIANDGYPASLEPRKVYEALRDPVAEEHGLLRVIDESGEDYLFPKGLFRDIELSPSVKKAVLASVSP
jgi:hypothetical protein